MSFFKRFIFLLGVLFSVFASVELHAQSDARTHFIYIQSENQQQYYVILNKKSYSSSSIGYLIISKLVDGEYNVTIGFPQDIYPAQTYLLKVHATDAGYKLLKGNGDKWELIDKLTQKSLPIVQTSDNNQPTVTKNNSANSDNGSSSGFGALLSKTSNDTTNYQAYANPNTSVEKLKTKEGAKENVAAAVVPKKGRAKPDTNVEENTTAVEKDIAKTKEEYGNESYETASARSATQSVVKIAERSDRRGVSMSFVISGGDKLDTINSFFPGDSKKSILEDDDKENISKENTASVSPEKEALKKEVDNRKSTNNPFYKGSSDTQSTDKSSSLGLFADDESSKENKSKTTKEDNTGEIKSNTNASKEIFNSTCSSVVSDKDMEKIRKKMISKSSDEDMIAIARKYVDTKCIYTAQVKELGGLLISDNGRFALYRIMYPNVYDGAQFSTLKDQLLDKNYKSQFETLINNH